MSEPMFTSAAGVSRRWVDNNDGSYSVIATQDVEGLLDANKAAYTHNDGYSPTRELRRVAFVPDVVALKWLQEEGWWYLDPACKDKLLAKLDDPDYLALRTAPGRVGKRQRMI